MRGKVSTVILFQECFSNNRADFALSLVKICFALRRRDRPPWVVLY
jgi:hypothetical protein